MLTCLPRGGPHIRLKPHSDAQQRSDAGSDQYTLGHGPVHGRLGAGGQHCGRECKRVSTAVCWRATVGSGALPHT